ncbi:hypothetical protein [Pleomorphomonas sp. JP5]|uniref:hypothetical protein n=1 Tax=Pleomorphomonas sp. JP5 TaxID=2942998 RepID=UPI0020446DAA|nr:hypothetical protein [Pleomorphomonas sp. JP5]MCM5557441.1 hypothetical protein [Pleomorphomonas sp. JP5]
MKRMSGRSTAGESGFLTEGHGRMPQTFGMLLGKEIEKQLQSTGKKQIEVVKISLGINPESSESSLTDSQSQKVRNGTRRLSELKRGGIPNPTPSNYLPYCEVLGISSERLNKLRQQAVSPEEKLIGWPELKTTEVPIDLVVRDFRYTIKGFTALSEAERAYSRTSERIRIHPHGVGVYDPSVNAFLLRSGLSGCALPVKIDEKYLAYNVNNIDDCQLLSYVVSEKANKGAKLFNSRKIRLSSDIPSKGGGVVHLRETDYCSSLMTDQLAFQQIYIDDPKSPRILRDGLTEFMRDGRLIALDDADGMSNQLGASTIAFSRDGKLLHVEQTRQNAQSMGLLAPSGSGSLDWEDIFEGRVECASGRREDLLSIVSIGAARELVEECGLHVQHNKEDPYIGIDEVAKNYLKVFGFSRMLHRGGKPEFYCVSVLPFDQFDVERAILAKEEEPYTRRTRRSQAMRVDFAGSLNEVRHAILRVCEEFMGPFSVDMLRKNRELDFLSFPLSHAFELLVEAINGPCGNELVEFLKSASVRQPG